MSEQMGEIDELFEAPPGWLTLAEVTERLGPLGDLAIDAIQAGRIEAVRERWGRGWRYLVSEASLDRFETWTALAVEAIADEVGVRAELDAFLAERRTVKA